MTEGKVNKVAAGTHQVGRLVRIYTTGSIPQADLPVGAPTVLYKGPLLHCGSVDAAGEHAGEHLSSYFTVPGHLTLKTIVKSTF